PHLRLRARRRRTHPRGLAARRARGNAALAPATGTAAPRARMKIDYELPLAPQTAEADMKRRREDFPALRQRVHGRPLVYLDTGATTQKPQAVIDAETAFYARDNANVHRAVHTLSERATEAYETARRKVQRFINAAAPEEIVFVHGTTEAI